MQLPLQAFARPTSAEIQEIQAKVADNCRAMNDIDMQIQELLQQKLRLNDENATYKSILAPIRRLAFDVLSHIFYYHVVVNLEDPWILAHVSRTWRLTAFSTPSLWTGIHLQLDPDTTKQPLHRRVDGREFCGTIKQLELALMRASSHALDIKLSSPPAIPTVVRAHIPLLLHCVALRMDRWRSFEVDGAISHLPGLNRCPLDSLERLVLKTGDRSLLRLINETAVELKDFTTTMLGLEEFADAVWWETLRHLDLTVPIDATRAPQTPTLISVLSRAKLLETLSLDFHQMQPQSTPLAALPNLRKLELYDIPQLLPFDCPNLTHLKISVPKKRPVPSTAPLPTPAIPIVLPHLTHLVFQHPNISALAGLVAPNLVELTISPQVRIIAPQFNDNALRTIWSAERRDSVGVLTPRVLRLEDVHVSADSIEHVLGFIGDLKELVIRWIRTDHAAVLKLLSSSVPARPSQAPIQVGKPSTPPPTRRPLLCPSLRHLAYYDSSTLRLESTKAMQASFEEVVRVRRDLGAVGMKGVIGWPNGGDITEFRV